jgi:hypothetical protein
VRSLPILTLSSISTPAVPHALQDYETATPEIIARAVAEELGKRVEYRPVEADGAARAARLVAELI